MKNKNRNTKFKLTFENKSLPGNSNKTTKFRKTKINCGENLPITRCNMYACILHIQPVEKSGVTQMSNLASCTNMHVRRLAWVSRIHINNKYIMPIRKIVIVILFLKRKIFVTLINLCV